MTAYYNEIDPKAAAWLRELIARNLIAPGDVDERSIEDVVPTDLAGYTQCHFFAGIGGWSYALRLAGWPDDRPVWTGSCPCQPFSAAGKGDGFADERHLWPAFQHLIAQQRPAIVFGEQVASKGADAWIDLVHADLEGMGYAFGCVPFPSAGIGAPHIRDRNFWVAVGLADSHQPGLEGRRIPAERATKCVAGPRGLACGLADADGGNASAERQQRGGQQRLVAQDSGVVRLGDSDRAGPQPGRQAAEAAGHGRSAVADGDLFGLADPNERAGRQGRAIDGRRHPGSDALARPGLGGSVMHHGEWPSPTNGFWRAADWLGCTDGKWRPVEPGTQPLAHGIPARVVRLRGYGNAINAEAAAAFIEAYLHGCAIEADARLIA